MATGAIGAAVTVWQVGPDRFGAVDLASFHRDELPALLAGRGPVCSDADVRVVEPLAFRLDDARAYTYVPAGHSFRVEPGVDSAHTVVDLEGDPWCAFRWEPRAGS